MPRYFNDGQGPRRGTALNAPSIAGQPRGAKIGRQGAEIVAEGSRDSGDRPTRVLQEGSTRSPARPTATNVATGTAGSNGIGGLSPAKTKSAVAPCSMPGPAAAMPQKTGPAGGMPGKGGPNRSAGVPGGPFYVKREGF